VELEAIIQYIANTFSAVDVQRPTDGPGAGDVFFIHAEDTRQFPFATIVTKNYPGFDEESRLDRPGVFRMNMGVSRDTFRRLFPTNTDHDYAALDVLMPHPVYAPQSFVSVLNPSDTTFESVKPLLAEAYAQATKRVGAK
jgi:hypothetical protein